MNASANWRLNSSWSPSKLVKCEWKATKLWNIFFTSRVTSFSHSGFIVTLCGFCDNRVEYAWLESGETMEDLIQCRLQLFLDTAQATTMFLLHRQSLHLQIFVHLQLMLRLVLLQLVLQLNVQLHLQLHLPHLHLPHPLPHPRPHHHHVELKVLWNLYRQSVLTQNLNNLWWLQLAVLTLQR